MGGNTGMLGGSGGSMPSMPSMPGPVSMGSGGQMIPTSIGSPPAGPVFGSMAPLASLFMNNRPTSGAPAGPGWGGMPGGGGSAPPVSQPIQQPQPNPNPAWESIPTNPIQQPAPPPPTAAAPQTRRDIMEGFMAGPNANPFDMLTLLRNSPGGMNPAPGSMRGAKRG